jgi:hypothetical protein
MWLAALALGCTDDRVPLDGGDSDATSPEGQLVAIDQAPASGYLDTWLGHFERGRNVTVADVDSDGDPDVISGNPGDTTFVLFNDTPPGGPLAFRRGQELETTGLPYWSIAASDFDNDGDPDLFVGYGGNEGVGFDRVYRNDGDADVPFVDVSVASGVTPVDIDGNPLPHATAGSLVLDFDNDGLLDVYASDMVHRSQMAWITLEDRSGLNQLWRNLGGLTFENVGLGHGLFTQRSTRHSVFLDIENDGDLDLFENNYDGGNVLWRNRLVEAGIPVFEDVTAEMSLNGGDLSFPMMSGSMATIAADLDNDGYEDLVVYRRNGPKEPGEPENQSAGHLLWMNQQGQGFVDVAMYTDLNDSFVWRDHDVGVMGCQIADFDADGFPDIFVGNGGPGAGEVSQLFLSTTRTTVEIEGIGTVTVPQFEDRTALIDAPSEIPASYAGTVPVYPYRTHGSAAADFDGDGDLELAQNNGGPMDLSVGPAEMMQEPDRLWDFVFPDPKPHWLWVDLVGDGLTVNRDAVGAKVHLQAEQEDGTVLDLYQVRRTQTGFSAQNQGGVYFGLGQAVSIVSLVVTWPDGTVRDVPAPSFDRHVTVTR